MSILFVGGLKDDIRSEVMRKDQWSWGPLLEEARNVELNLSEKKKEKKGFLVAAVGEEQGEEDETVLMVAAMFEKTFGVKPGEQICYRCNKPGHFAANCRSNPYNGKRGGGGGNRGSPRGRGGKSVGQVACASEEDPTANSPEEASPLPDNNFYWGHPN